PAGAECEVDPAYGEQVDGRCLLVEHDRMAVVVVEHERADTQRRRCIRGRHQRRDRARLVREMVRQVKRRVTHRLDTLRCLAPLPRAACVVRLHGESKWSRSRHQAISMVWLGWPSWSVRLTHL